MTHAQMNLIAELQSMASQVEDKGDHAVSGLLTRAHLALTDAQAENARLTKECDSFEVANIAVAFERDKALARLAESEAQNLMARQIILEHGEGVAGASPQQSPLLQFCTCEDCKPMECEGCRINRERRELLPAPDEAAREYMTGYSDCKEWAQPSQAVELELSDAEIKKISSDLSLYEDYQPESCQADYLDPVKFARAIIAVINAKEQPNG